MEQKEAIERLIQYKEWLSVFFNGDRCESITTKFEVYRRDNKVILQFGDDITVEDLLSATDKVIPIINKIKEERDYEKGSPNIVKALKAHLYESRNSC